MGVTVTDAWQRRGIATILIRALMRFARAHGFRQLTGVVPPDNQAMLEFARGLGFIVTMDATARVMSISHDLAPMPGDAAPAGIT